MTEGFHYPCIIPDSGIMLRCQYLQTRLQSIDTLTKISKLRIKALFLSRQFMTGVYFQCRDCKEGES